MKTGSPSVPSVRRRPALRERKRSIDRFTQWQHGARLMLVPFQLPTEVLLPPSRPRRR